MAANAETAQNQAEEPGANRFEALSFGLLAATVLLYATGFIVVFTYEHRLRLVAASGDFFKLKYLQVGMLACAFVLLFGGPSGSLHLNLRV